MQINGYKLHRLDRLHKRRGGVCAYIHRDLKSSVLKDLSSISDQNFHQLWLNVQYKKLKSVVICVTYRPDDSPLSSFEEVLKPNYIQALTLNKPIIILGDLNCIGFEKSCPKFKALEKFCSEMNLKQLISTPTRITPHTQTLLDVIMVSPNCSVSNNGVIHRPISDHSIVFARLKITKQKTVPQYVTTRSYKHYNGKQFACDLAKEAEALLTTFDKPDVDAKLKNLMDTISTPSTQMPLKSKAIFVAGPVHLSRKKSKI